VVAAVFLAHAVYGLNLQEAIDAPMFDSEHFPSSFYRAASRPGVVEIESRAPEPTLDELRRAGTTSRSTSVVARPPERDLARPDGTLRAGANPRGMQGYAAGR
jgi:gamma-glutamyltranspeptidase/glutathione hydrolase